MAWPWRRGTRQRWRTAATITARADELGSEERNEWVKEMREEEAKLDVRAIRQKRKGGDELRWRSKA